MKYIAIIYTLFCIALCKAQTPAVSIQTMQEKVIGKEVQLIDVRSLKEYKEGYIDDAVRMGIANKSSFKQQIETLDKSKPVYLYCYSGVRSHRACKILKASGFKEVYDFSGGWKAWSKYKQTDK